MTKYKEFMRGFRPLLFYGGVVPFQIEAPTWWSFRPLLFYGGVVPTDKS